MLFNVPLPGSQLSVLSLAGGQLPTDRAFDGRDLSGVLGLNSLGSSSDSSDSSSSSDSSVAGADRCIFHWHGSSLANGGEGLTAVRCGDMKAHFYTQVRIYVEYKDFFYTLHHI